MTTANAAKKAKDVKADLRRLADVVQREVDAGADTVEEIHLAIARMPLDVLAKLDIFESTVKDVRKVQEASIGAIYEAIHKVNHEVGKLAKELLGGRVAGSKKAARPAAKKAAAKARSTAPAAATGSRPHTHA